MYLRFLQKNNHTYRVIKMSVLMEAIELASDSGTYYYDFIKQESIYLSEDSWNWDKGVHEFQFKFCFFINFINKI